MGIRKDRLNVAVILSTHSTCTGIRKDRLNEAVITRTHSTCMGIRKDRLEYTQCMYGYS